MTIFFKTFKYCHYYTFLFLQRCDICTYINPNSDKVVKHIALGHSKLDEMLQDDELVQKKRALASLRPKRENIGPECPICNVRDPPREHVARHFGDELNELVMPNSPTLKSAARCRSVKKTVRNHYNSK